MNSAHDEPQLSQKELCGLFVTGTDTGVGKTFVTGAIVAALRADGINAGVWKPVQSGALLGSGTTDAERLLQMTGIREHSKAVAPYTFEAPLTPMLAARQVGVKLSLEEIIRAGDSLIHRYEVMFIEGAGGLAVPLTEHDMVIDLIAKLGVPALIIARNGLGTINHTLLTVSLLRQRKIPVIGVVMNDADQTARLDDPSIMTNGSLIEQYGGVRVLGSFPRLQGIPERDKLIQTVRSRIDLTLIRTAIESQTIRESGYSRCEVERDNGLDGTGT